MGYSSHRREVRLICAYGFLRPLPLLPLPVSLSSSIPDPNSLLALLFDSAPPPPPLAFRLTFRPPPPPPPPTSLHPSPPPAQCTFEVSAEVELLRCVWRGGGRGLGLTKRYFVDVLWDSVVPPGFPCAQSAESAGHSQHFA